MRFKKGDIVKQQDKHKGPIYILILDIKPHIGYVNYKSYLQDGLKTYYFVRCIKDLHINYEPNFTNQELNWWIGDKNISYRTWSLSNIDEVMVDSI